MRWRRILDKRSRRYVMAVGLCAIGAVGFLDYLTGPELSFSIFYLLPISMLAWYGGIASGIVGAVVSAVAWFGADLLTGHQHSHPAIPFWNAMVRLGVFAVVAAILSFLRRSEERKSELLSFIVHDLRSPLTNVMVGLEILRSKSENTLGGRQQEFVELCMASCRRMLALTEAMLDLSRLEAGRMPLDIADADVRTLVDQSLGQVALSAEHKGVHLNAEVPAGNLRLRADSEITVRILVNLLANAVKFTPPESTVTVGAREIDGAVQFTVTDEGEGVPKEWAEKVFDKFVQVESRSGGASIGTGLGLAFAREAVQAQGGRIWIDTDRERGTAVRFTLPLSASVQSSLR